MKATETGRFLTASRYDFTTDSGERITGTKAVFAVGLHSGSDPNAMGYDVQLYNGPFDLYDRLSNLSPMQEVVFEAELKPRQKAPNLRRLVDIREIDFTFSAFGEDD